MGDGKNVTSMSPRQESMHGVTPQPNFEDLRKGGTS